MLHSLRLLLLLLMVNIFSQAPHLDSSLWSRLSILAALWDINLHIIARLQGWVEFELRAMSR